MGPRGACQHAQYSTGIYIRKLFTSAHDEICQDFVPSAARRSSPPFPFLSLFFSSFLLVFSSGSFSLSFPPNASFSVLTFLPHGLARGTHNEEKVALFSRIRPSPEAARNYIWVLIKRRSRERARRDLDFRPRGRVYAARDR